MDPLSIRAYAGLVAALVLKLFVLTAIQGRVRIGSRVFRWPEDAQVYGGEARPSHELEVVERAQAALRNDAENHPYVLAAAAVWVALGAPGPAACVLFGAYALVRWAHGVLLLRPLQPIRTRVYAIGQLAMLAIVVDALRRAVVA